MAKLSAPIVVSVHYRVNTRGESRNVPVRERVKDLRVPTLLVCGERETRFMPLRAFAEREIPGLQVVGPMSGMP